MSSVVYNPDKTQLYSGGYDHSVRIWDVESASNTATMNCECVILDMDHSLSSGLLVSGHSDNLLRVWDPRMQDGLVVKMRFAGHRNWVSSVSWSPSSMFMLASASYDGAVKVWDIRSSTSMFSMKSANESKLLAVDWKDDLLAAGGEDGQLYLFAA